MCYVPVGIVCITLCYMALDIYCFLLLGKHEIRSLMAVCDNNDNGCQWSNELRFLEEHVANCDYLMVPCPRLCISEDRSPTVVFRRDLESHVTSQCSKREVICTLYWQTTSYEEIITNHPNTSCLEEKVPCPNHSCKAKFPRRSTDDHLSVCKYQLASCKYQEFGCMYSDESS